MRERERERERRAQSSEKVGTEENSRLIINRSGLRSIWTKWDALGARGQKLVSLVLRFHPSLWEGKWE